MGSGCGDLAWTLTVSSKGAAAAHADVPTCPPFGAPLLVPVPPHRGQPFTAPTYALLLHQWLLVHSDAGGVEQRLKHLNVMFSGMSCQRCMWPGSGQGPPSELGLHHLAAQLRKAWEPPHFSKALHCCMAWLQAPGSYSWVMRRRGAPHSSRCMPSFWSKCAGVAGKGGGRTGMHSVARWQCR